MLLELKLILWKNYIIRKRHWFLTLVEVMIPILLFLLIAYLRSILVDLLPKMVTKPSFYMAESEGRLYQNFRRHVTNLYYSPKGYYTNRMMMEIAEKFQLKITDPQMSNLVGFDNESDLIDYYMKSKSYYTIAVIFTDIPENINNHIFAYKIRLYKEDDKKFEEYSRKLYTDDPLNELYLDSFVPLQLAIDTTFIELNKRKTNKQTVYFEIDQFPYPPYRDNAMNEVLLYYIALNTLFSFIFLCPALLMRVVEEKSSGIKQLMCMVGMKKWMLWLGWFLHAISVNFPAVMIVIILLKVDVFGSGYPPIEFCDFSLLAVFFLLYSVTSIAFCFFISTLFNHPAISMVFGIIMWISTYFLPKLLMDTYDLKWDHLVLLGIFPNTALHHGFKALSLYGIRGVEQNWGNLFKPGTEQINTVTMGNVLIIFTIDIIIFMILSFYLENILPGTYGIRKSCLFPLEPLKKLILGSASQTMIGNAEELRDLKYIEEGHGQESRIEIQGLRKKFGNFFAVDGLDLNIYKNQITVLLGHNGAGKTTTMSIITGMIPASSGVIRFKEDVGRNKKDLKIGLCPQHNLLFKDLTVQEHLKFFAMLKGSSFKESKTKSDHLLKRINMWEKRNSKPDKLSGGMKRKLCLGMALIGDSNILILDEPTSGMDPESRRKVWDIFHEYRRTKTILVTTHIMEEADAIGDWIAIMANGKLQCYGTSMFLKNQFATGYLLSITMKKKYPDIVDVIEKGINGAKLISENNLNLAFNLPLNMKHEFAKVLRQINLPRNGYGISNMRLTITTLDDVFLKAKKKIDDANEEKEDGETLQDLTNFPEVKKTFLLTLYALFLKRFYFLRRKLILFFPSIAISICLFILTIYLGYKTGMDDPPNEIIDLKLSSYGKTSVFYSSFGEFKILKEIEKHYKDLIEEEKSNAYKRTNASVAILDKGIDDISYYKKYIVVSAEFISIDSIIGVKALYSYYATLSIPIAVNLVTNAIAKTLVGENCSISTSNDPLPRKSQIKLSKRFDINEITVYWMFFTTIGILFLMGVFLIFPFYEISTGFTRIQLLNNVHVLTYWITTLVFDYLFSVVCLALLIFFSVIVLKRYSGIFGTEEYVCALTIISVYIFCAMPLVYLFAHKKTIAGAFGMHIMLSLFIAIAPTVVIFSFIMMPKGYYLDIVVTLRDVFLIFCPPFGLGFTFLNFARMYPANLNWNDMNEIERKDMCKKEKSNPCCVSEEKCLKSQDYFFYETHGVYKNLLTMLASFVIYFSLLIGIYLRPIRRALNWTTFQIISLFTTKKIERDNDLRVSAQNIQYLNAENLSKSYCGKQVVKSVNFNFKLGECFGLLGVNGAGKTTTFGMFTGDVCPDSGKVYIQDGNRSYTNKSAKYYRRIGYCPQTNALNFALTTRENVKIHALLSGHGIRKIDEIVIKYLKLFDLNQYANKKSSSLSGGNKRKLMTCLAFVGLPKIILLDEPTSGVDPSSRRVFWKTLSQIRENMHTCFVLCSHSMEECEVLCDSLAIMKAGKIECAGTLNELKDAYQKGFSVVLKTKIAPDEDVVKDVVGERDTSPVHPIIEEVQQRFKAMFPSSELRDFHSGSLFYYVEHTPEMVQTIGDMFEKMEKLKNLCPLIEDYTISEASLEDIFMNIANA